jgi:hypothetical protein
VCVISAIRPNYGDDHELRQSDVLRGAKDGAKKERILAEQIKDMRSDRLGDSAPWGLIQQLIETTGNMLEIEWQGSVLTN